MPATARLRVRGAITSRLGRVIGPSLKGARSSVGEFILLFPQEMTGERQMVSFITAAMPRAIRDTQVSRARYDAAPRRAVVVVVAFSLIALIGYLFRHCERSEAIHVLPKNGLLRRFAPRNDGEGCRSPRRSSQ